MAKFPRDEAKLILLANEIADGFEENPEIFPAPPVDVQEVRTWIAACIKSRDAVQVAKSTLEEAVNTKKTDFEALEERMKRDIRYAENTVNDDDAKLKLIGWSGRKTAAPLAVPGQVRKLAIQSQERGALTLTWEKPTDGGKVSAYRVQRREECDGGPWRTAEMSMKTKSILSDQEEGKPLEYRVLAANKAGEGLPSNTVTATL